MNKDKTWFIMTKNDTVYGKIGQSTGYLYEGREIRIGDLVCYKSTASENNKGYAPVIEHGKKCYSLMGWIGIEVNGTSVRGHEHYKITNVIPYDCVDIPGLFEKNYKDYLYVKELEKLTKEDAERRFGIEIVKEYE